MRRCYAPGRNRVNDPRRRADDWSKGIEHAADRLSCCDADRDCLLLPRPHVDDGVEARVMGFAQATSDVF